MKYLIEAGMKRDGKEVVTASTVKDFDDDEAAVQYANTARIECSFDFVTVWGFVAETRA